MDGSAIDNGHPPRRGVPPRVVIGMLADKETRETLTAAANLRGIPCAFEIGGIEKALAGLQPDEKADCVIVDIEDSPDAIEDVAVLAMGLPRDAELVLLGRFTSDQAYEFAQAGAALCLPKPISEAAINRIFGNVRALASPDVPLPDILRRQVAMAPEEAIPAPQAPRSTIRLGPAEPVELPPYHSPAVEPGQQAPTSSYSVQSLDPADPMEPPIVQAADRRIAQDRPRTEPVFPGNPARRPHHPEAPPSYRQPAIRPTVAHGRVISVVGCRGGVGASTIAVGLAWLMAAEMGRNTALVDLDPYFGSIALALNLDPGDALLQALERPGRIDSVFLERAVRKFGPNLFVLSSENSLDKQSRPDPNGPSALIKGLCARHERIVVDLPRGEPESMLRVLSLSDEVILVTDLSLAGARDAMRMMALVRGAAAYARMRIVCGGARDTAKHPILSPSEFRRAVGCAIDIVIAHDCETASDAARSGRPIPKVFPRSAATKAMRNLAQSMESSEPQEHKRRLLFWKK